MTVGGTAQGTVRLKRRRRRGCLFSQLSWPCLECRMLIAAEDVAVWGALVRALESVDVLVSGQRSVRTRGPPFVQHFRRGGTREVCKCRAADTPLAATVPQAKQARKWRGQAPSAPGYDQLHRCSRELCGLVRARSSRLCRCRGRPSANPTPPRPSRWEAVHCERVQVTGAQQKQELVE